MISYGSGVFLEICGNGIYDMDEYAYWSKETYVNSKKLNKKQDCLLWIEISCGHRKIYIATVYMVPVGSSYYEDNDKIRNELEKDIVAYKEQGMVIVIGDFNSRIGKLMSITADDKTYHRENVDEKENQNGRELIKLMNGLGMLILSGIISK